MGWINPFYRVKIGLIVSTVFIVCSIYPQKFEKLNQLESQLKEEVEHHKLADIYLELSELYAYSNKEKALEKARRSLTISKSLQDIKRQTDANFQIGSLEAKLGNYELSLNALYAALKANEEINNYETVSIAYLHIGDVYMEKGDFNSSQEFYNKAMEQGISQTCDLCIALANMHFGILEHSKGKDNLSLQYHLEALKYIEETNAIEEKAEVLFHVGSMYRQTRQNDKALEHLTNSLKLYETLENGEMRAIISYEIGIIYQEKGSNENALIYLKNSLGWAEKNGLKAYIKKGYENISEVYENSGDYEHAYEYLKYFDAIKDTREITELESKLELEKKKREIQILNKERDFRAQQLRSEQILKFIGFIALFIFGVLVIFLLWTLRQKNKINEQLQLASDDANRSRKEKEEFFAYTSHEIRTPLNAVVGMSKLLAETDLSPMQQSYLKTIKSSASNILFLVNDVLDLSKIESGAIELETIDFSIKDIVDEVLHSLSFKVREKEVELLADIDDELPKVVKGDPIRINQVILNLADNAIKFTNSGEVKINVAQLKETEKTVTIHFAVSDTGIGIRKSRLESIFDSFRQESSHTTRQYGGTGLGLAITQKLIELMGGSIQVESTYGEGSVFFFDITFKKSKADNLSVQINEDQHIGIKDVKVLVVDDNALNREIFFDLINDYKQNVIVDLADDGKMALSKIAESDYDIVLMDIQMPRMDGYEATRKIREIDGPKSQIPVVAMTAHVLDGVAKKCEEAGMNDCISKPINLKLLTQKIKQYVKQDAKAFETASSKTEEHLDFETTHVDLKPLLELTNQDLSKVDKYIGIFFNNVPHDLERMKDAIEEENFTLVAEMAHKMKGNVGYMGISSIKEDLLELEKLNKVVGELEEITDIVSRVEVVIELAIKELKKVRNKINNLKI